MKTCLKGMVVVLAVVMAGCGSEDKPVTQAPASSVSKALAAEKASAQLLQQGVAFLNKKDVPRAVISLRGAIEVNPKELQAYILLSEIFMRLRSYPESIEVLERAAKNFPNDAYVFYLLSVANHESDHVLPAVLAARRSVELFKAQNNKEGYERSVLLLKTLVQMQQEREQKAAQAATGAAPAPASQM